MTDEFLEVLRREHSNLADLIYSRPTEDWTRERAWMAELDARIREHKERSNA